ncbi:hypothetical protein FH972_002691 [Carpinus fangiana]|uniref:Uncharacterized protein n=1 Tax=Carpinus fangiana TaxID=176857 RepID=A0A5N6QG57_9ROSI|nr:hypothetical protein FH972_002691 [Carpinus fangiana]
MPTNHFPFFLLPTAAITTDAIPITTGVDSLTTASIPSLPASIPSLPLLSFSLTPSTVNSRKFNSLPQARRRDP